uniref:TRAF-type domain-containing protein n=1 Tax=Amphimedon queenslandica TaxID=400682 RepID=A0A1X7VN42_AMPQE
MCREPMGANSYFKDGRLEREIKSLKIYCTRYDKEGCQWEGSISDFTREHVHTCLYQLIECTCGCGAKMLRTDVEAHLSEVCSKRMISCEYCRRKGPHNLITGAALLNECSLSSVYFCV